ncbi:MAG: hypothetical protein H8E78_07330 [Proteobacteria bacterium]|nr:hypothetical protein [Pseudomonadota bacterium]
MNDPLDSNEIEILHSKDWTRRRFLRRAGVGALGTAIGLYGRKPYALAATAANSRPDIQLLEASPFVYVSPIRTNGKESTCHAELWYAWLDDSIIVTVAADRWKATALDKGLDRARIWVGDHGRWKTFFGGRNEKFRVAPNFLADAERVDDPKMIDRLIAVYDEKYPEEIAQWRSAMISGSADGSRILIRYRLATVN